MNEPTMVTFMELQKIREQSSAHRITANSFIKSGKWILKDKGWISKYDSLPARFQASARELAEMGEIEIEGYIPIPKNKKKIQKYPKMAVRQ
jgi:hypothetical protein